MMTPENFVILMRGLVWKSLNREIEPQAVYDFAARNHDLWEIRGDKYPCMYVALSRDKRGITLPRSYALFILKEVDKYKNSARINFDDILYGVETL